MMDELTKIEKEKYEKHWLEPVKRQRIINHGLDLLRHYPNIIDDAKTIIDIGCGTGKCFQSLRDQGLDAWGLDIAYSSLDPDIHIKSGAFFLIYPLWDMIPSRIRSQIGGNRFDLGLCCDVMEHLPEEKIDDSFKMIYEIAEDIHFWIATHPVGGNLHLTLQSIDWWLDKIIMAIPNSHVELIADSTFNRFGDVRLNSFYIRVRH